MKDKTDHIKKGLLMNLGFDYVTETLKPPYGCVVFNDVDLVPINDITEYRCESQPLHLSTTVNGKK